MRLKPAWHRIEIYFKKKNATGATQSAISRMIHFITINRILRTDFIQSANWFSLYCLCFLYLWYIIQLSIITLSIVHILMIWIIRYYNLIAIDYLVTIVTFHLFFPFDRTWVQKKTHSHIRVRVFSVSSCWLPLRRHSETVFTFPMRKNTRKTF